MPLPAQGKGFVVGMLERVCPKPSVSAYILADDAANQARMLAHPMESRHQEHLNKPKPQLGKPTKRQCSNKSGICRYAWLLLGTPVP